MQRILASIALFAIAVAAGYAPAQAHSRLAPADEYFGRMQMSIIGIHNELRTVAGRVEADPTNAESQLGLCDRIEDALEDFGSKYPQDTWLKPMVSDLERIYSAIQTPNGQEHANHLTSWAQSIGA